MYEILNFKFNSITLYLLAEWQFCFSVQIKSSPLVVTRAYHWINKFFNKKFKTNLSTLNKNETDSNSF